MKKENRTKPPSGSKSLRFILIIAGFLLALTASFFLFNKWEIELTIHGEDDVRIEYMQNYEDPGASAIYRSSLLPFIQEEVDVKVASNTVNPKKTGHYSITYQAEHKNVTASKSRNVSVVDTTPPTITLTENPDSYTPFNHEYQEEGFAAKDIHDGDLSDKVIREVIDDEVIYTVKDSSGNKAIKKRKIRYDDRKGPELSFPDGTDLVLYKGTPFTDSFTAVDDCDGDVTSKVTVEGSVNTDVCDTYTLTYTVSDSHNNTTVATRNITIRTRPINNPSTSDGPKTIYHLMMDLENLQEDCLISLTDTMSRQPSLQPPCMVILIILSRKPKEVIQYVYTHIHTTMHPSIRIQTHTGLTIRHRKMSSNS